MVMVPISELKPGDRLSQDIYSKLGGIVMPKQRVLSDRDLEVFQAFMITQVEIDRSSEKETASSHAASTEARTQGRAETSNVLRISPTEKVFLDLWMELAAHVSRMMEPSAVIRLPMLELRGVLDQLIQHIDQYHPMSVKSQIANYMGDDPSDYLIHKSIAVGLTSYLIGQWCKFSSKESMQITLAGLLHDIGKIKINESVINKRGSLNSGELVEVRRHSQYGYEILRNTPAINDGVKLAALQHHEQIDGGGYPLRISGEKIHPYAKIVAIADMFHAMTMDRVYKTAESPFIALDKLREASYGKLDPQMVLTFIHKMVDLVQGAKVKLNDGRVGRIVFIDNQKPTRPWVSIQDTIVHLSQNKNLYISEIIND